MYYALAFLAGIAIDRAYPVPVGFAIKTAKAWWDKVRKAPASKEDAGQ